jgi:hypothetical protein
VACRSREKKGRNEWHEEFYACVAWDDLSRKQRCTYHSNILNRQCKSRSYADFYHCTMQFECLSSKPGCECARSISAEPSWMPAVVVDRLGCVHLVVVTCFGGLASSGTRSYCSAERSTEVSLHDCEHMPVRRMNVMQCNVRSAAPPQPGPTARRVPGCRSGGWGHWGGITCSCRLSAG